MDYDYELMSKSAIVAELFREHGITIDAPKIFTDGHRFKYRNKMEYSLYYDHDTMRIFPSFHVRGSHRKIPITHSSIECPEILAAALKTIDDMNTRHDEARRYQSLLLRSDAAGHVSGGLYENHQPHPVFDNLSDTILGHTYSYSPNGFFQINLPVYEAALVAMRPFVATREVLDLYAGVGTIGLSIARDHELTLVEVNGAAYGELVKNAAGLPVATLLEKSESVTDIINDRQTVIVDPPRAGCDTKLISRLLEVRPPRIIYLSCNPATQARDVAILMGSYRIDAMESFNFFPATPHIENLVILSHI